MAPIFRNVYNVLYKGYPIDSIEDLHKLTELNGIMIPKLYRCTESTMKIIYSIANILVYPVYA